MLLGIPQVTGFPITPLFNDKQWFKKEGKYKNNLRFTILDLRFWILKELKMFKGSAVQNLRSSEFGVPCSILFDVKITLNKEHRIMNFEDFLSP